MNHRIPIFLFKHRRYVDLIQRGKEFLNTKLNLIAGFYIQQLDKYLERIKPRDLQEEEGSFVMFYPADETDILNIKPAKLSDNDILNLDLYYDDLSDDPNHSMYQDILTIEGLEIGRFVYWIIFQKII